MDQLTLPYRYLNQDDEIIQEYEEIRIDHDSQELSLDFGPVGIEGGDELGSYLDEPDYLSEPDRETVRRRLPELDDLADLARDEIIDILVDDTPATYWEQPASGSGEHHPPDERGPHGQWIHTKRVIRSYDHLARSAEEMDGLTDTDDLAYSMDEDDIRYGRMAAIIHDIHKFGEDGTAETAVPDHDTTAAEYIRDQTELPDPVADAVEAHNGPWYDGRPPGDDHEAFVHLADMTAADTASETLLQQPTPALKFAQLMDHVLRYDEDLMEYTVRFHRPEDL